MIEPPQQEDQDLRELLEETRAVVERVHQESKKLEHLVTTLVDTFDSDELLRMAEELKAVLYHIRKS